MFKYPMRCYAQMIYVGDVLVIGGNHYPVTAVRRSSADKMAVLVFHNEEFPDRKITLVCPANELFQIQTRKKN
jgi:hypothetical protein